MTAIFLLHQVSGIVIYATDAGLHFFQQSKVLLGVGTFKTAPPPFLEIYVIYGTHENYKITVIWAFLGSNTEVYKKFLETLKNKCFKKFQKILVPEFKITDYETGVISAIPKFFSYSTHLGCWFHYTQCIYRKKQEMGLTTQYKSDANFQKIARKLYSLAFF